VARCLLRRAHDILFVRKELECVGPGFGDDHLQMGIGMRN